MNSITNSTQYPVIKDQAGYILKGFKKTASLNGEKFESSIKKINESINWQEYHESIIKKLKERSSIKVFAFSKKENSIVGYAVAVEKKTGNEPKKDATFSVYDENQYSGYTQFYQYYEDKIPNIPEKIYNIYFLAVSMENQMGGIGRNVLLRLIEKIQKKGGTKIIFYYKNTEKLNSFYNNDNIPYSKKIIDDGDFPDGTPRKQAIYYC